ncbi:MAG: hypothetical protein ACM3PT_02985 [Deltaproteobacteria bacterium]
MLILKYTFPIYFVFCFSLNACSLTKPNNFGTGGFIINDFEVDKTGNYYLISTSGEIRKYSVDQQLLYTFKDFSNGEIASVDVTNPHKILVFYKDFQSITILDNTLSAIHHIIQDETKYITASGSSNDGNIWIYNAISNRILKISYEGKLLEELAPLPIPYPQNISDSKIYDRENKLFIFDKTTGIIILDNLGNFEKVIPDIFLTKPEFSKNIIYYYHKGSNSINSVDLLLYQVQLIRNLEDIDPALAMVRNGKLYMIVNNEMVISE